MPRLRTHHPIEMCLCFNFNTLVTNIRKEVIKKIGYRSTTEQRKEEIRKNLEAFTLRGQQFSFVLIKGGFKSFRWFVKCPRCGEPKVKLYLPDKYEDREQRYLCSDCHRLRTLSEIKGKCFKYKAILRRLKRMQVIKNTLLSRKKILPDQAAKLLDEYEEIERYLKSSAEYRRYRFDLEHGLLRDLKR